MSFEFDIQHHKREFETQNWHKKPSIIPNLMDTNLKTKINLDFLNELDHHSLNAQSYFQSHLDSLETNDEFDVSDSLVQQSIEEGQVIDELETNSEPADSLVNSVNIQEEAPPADIINGARVKFFRQMWKNFNQNKFYSNAYKSLIAYFHPAVAKREDDESVVAETDGESMTKTERLMSVMKTLNKGIWNPDTTKYADSIYESSNDERYASDDYFGHTAYSSKYGQSTDGQLHGKGQALPENLALFGGIAHSSILKKNDVINQELMTNSNLVSSLNTDFLSHLSKGRSSTEFEKMNTMLRNITEVEQLNFGYEEEENQDNDLNYENVRDPLSGKESNVIDINANYVTVGMADVIPTLSSEQKYYFLTGKYYHEQQLLNSYRDILGKAFDLPNVGSSDSEEQNTRVERMGQKMQDWYENIGTHLNTDEAHYATYFLHNPKELMSKLDVWRDWDSSMEMNGLNTISDSNGALRLHLIYGYLDHLKTQKLSSSEKVLDLSPLKPIFGEQQVNDVYDKLLTFNYINSQYEMQPSLLNSNGNIPALGLNSDLHEAVQSQLSSQFPPSNEFKQIQIIDADSQQPLSIDSIDEIITSTGVSESMYSSARKAYNHYFDIFESITGLHLNHQGSNGEPVLTQVDGGYEMEIHPQGITGEPVKHFVQTSDEAKRILNFVLTRISMLEPVVAGFDPVNSNGPDHKSWVYENGIRRQTNLRIIVDNTASTDSVEMINTLHPNYKMQVDFMFHHHKEGVNESEDDFLAVKGLDSYFSKGKNSWGALFNEKITKKASFTASVDMMNKSMFNIQSMAENRRKGDEYDTEYEQYIMEQLYREIKEYVARKKEENRQKKIEKEQEKRAQKEREKADKKAEKKS